MSKHYYVRQKQEREPGEYVMFGSHANPARGVCDWRGSLQYAKLYNSEEEAHSSIALYVQNGGLYPAYDLEVLALPGVTTVLKSYYLHWKSSAAEWSPQQYAEWLDSAANKRMYASEAEARDALNQYMANGGLASPDCIEVRVDSASKLPSTGKFPAIAPPIVGDGAAMTFGLPTDAAQRKAIPVYSGFIRYFPRAIAAVAELSRKGNDQHTPGKPLHWDRSKSGDELDALTRHLLDDAIGVPTDSDGVLHATKVAWRAMANLEKVLEALDRGG